MIGRIPGAVVRRSGKKVGVIFDPRDQEEAEILLRNLDSTAADAPGWDPRFESDVLTLDGGISMVFWGFALGGVVAFWAHMLEWRKGHANPHPPASPST